MNRKADTAILEVTVVHVVSRENVIRLCFLL